MATNETVRRRAYQRKRRETHGEQLNERSRQWYYAHRQQVLRKHRERMATDPAYAEKIRETARRGYAKRRDAALLKQQRREKINARNAARRELYRTDPAYRQKCLAQIARYVEQNREKIRARHLEKMADTEYRDAINKSVEKSRKKHRVERNRRNRERYATDPDHRAMRKQSAADAKLKRRALEK